MIRKFSRLAILPLLALACSFSPSALVVPLPSPTVETVQTPYPSPTHPPTRTHASTHACTVSAEVLHLRTEPGIGGVVIAWLNAGDVLTVFTDPPVGNWVRVQAGDLTGWINSNYCKEIPS